MMPADPDSELHRRANPWRAILRYALCETPGLVWVFPAAAVRAATLWRGMRGWVECLRELRIAPGDRLVLSGTPDFGWVGAAFAALWLEATLVLSLAGENAGASANLLDARLVIGPGGHIEWDEHGRPKVVASARLTRGLARPEVRFLLRTSGTGGEARWFALSDANVLAVLASHLPVLGLNHTHRLLSTLPWSHAFGLVLECLAALRAGASLVRCAVPAMVRRLAAETAGPAVLAGLRGGIIGGAALTAETCVLLAGTRLRVGYGQTEASPGITLGAPGEFSPNLLGRPVGNAVRLNAEGTYYFMGRSEDLVRLDNGRSLSAIDYEQRLQARNESIGEVMVWSPDGHGLALACTGIAPERAMLAECFGPLAARVRLRSRVPIEAWRFTRKAKSTASPFGGNLNGASNSTLLNLGIHVGRELARASNRACEQAAYFRKSVRHAGLTK